MNTKIKRAIIGSFAIILLLGICFSLFLLYIEESHKLPYKETTITGVVYTIECPENANKGMIKVEIDKLFGKNNYRLVECNLKYPVRGHADILTRNVQIDKDLSLEEFAFVLAHELVHINYFTKGERFCNIKAFEILYNSNNDYFKNVALMFASRDLRGNFDYEYSFVGYIENTLQNYLTT